MHYGAGYKLHEEVKSPTPSLLRASQIGVLVHDEPGMKDAEDRDALLVVSYGTARQVMRGRTVEPLLDAVAEENPEADIYEAYTSKIMCKRAREEGTEVPLVAEALEGLAANGYTRVAVASLHLFPGVEYEGMTSLFNSYRTRFKRLALGTPLLYWMGQEDQRDDARDLVEALRREMPAPKTDGAVLFMAHGTLHPSNSYYMMLQTRIEMAGWPEAFVYTMKGWPRLEHVLPKLKEKGVRHVTLAPLMMAAGSHVSRDMAGDDPSSHRSRLEAEGFSVEIFPKSLGELPSVRKLYVERVNEVWDALKGN